MLLCPWDFPGKSTGVGCYFLLHQSLGGLSKHHRWIPHRSFWYCISNKFQVMLMLLVLGPPFEDRIELWLTTYLRMGITLHYFADKGPSSQSYGFSSSHVWMWELDYKESWPPKNWCFWTLVLEKTLESPLDCKEIQPVHPKGNQSWIFIGRTDVEAETPILWPPDKKTWLIWKDPDAGKDWRQEKGNREDEMVGWNYRLNEHEFE